MSMRKSGRKSVPTEKMAEILADAPLHKKLAAPTHVYFFKKKAYPCVLVTDDRMVVGEARDMYLRNRKNKSSSKVGVVYCTDGLFQLVPKGDLCEFDPKTHGYLVPDATNSGSDKSPSPVAAFPRKRRSSQDLSLTSARDDSPSKKQPRRAQSADRSITVVAMPFFESLPLPQTSDDHAPTSNGNRKDPAAAKVEPPEKEGAAARSVDPHVRAEQSPQNTAPDGGNEGVSKRSPGGSAAAPKARRVALVTGAGSRLGRVICLRLARDNFAILAVDPSSEDLEVTERALSTITEDYATRTTQCTTFKEAQAMIDHLDLMFGDMDVAVNCCESFAVRSPLMTYPVASLDKTIAAALHAPVVCLRAQLARAAIRAKKTVILNVVYKPSEKACSMEIMAYDSLLSLTKSTAAEADNSIRINAVSVCTRYDATKVAESILWAASDKHCALMSGEALHVRGV